MNILNYKSYQGSIEQDQDRKIYRGHVMFISDLVTYEAASTDELVREFEAAIDDYLVTCAELGRAPQRPSAFPHQNFA